ncbi:hypothetical protein PSMK_29860 [Phycisphaera mikurensis NBRC 102666]|uniref:Uncharacterized protein n=1 Tax=Phycisphaera mikurensis (strain NBRC 102666 / KCTC 22515 / FYK2301M01) TaxID=1142394 RepID=I0IIQ7_PHYMF|nr:hypothetical protein PSMK_29860 [Phycisphaera mikurensis NBRC 102666]
MAHPPRGCRGGCERRRLSARHGAHGARAVAAPCSFYIDGVDEPPVEGRTEAAEVVGPVRGAWRTGCFWPVQLLHRRSR